jgi:hypothetical protein
MRTWNYRVFKWSNGNGATMEDYFSIHEVYYEDDKLTSYSEKPADVGSEGGIAELTDVLLMMTEALKRPILTKDDFPLSS